MTNNLESDVKYVPYKEVLKKRVFEYYYANKEVLSQKEKINMNSYQPKTKKSCKSIVNNILISKRLKNNVN